MLTEGSEHNDVPHSRKAVRLDDVPAVGQAS